MKHTLHAWFRLLRIVNLPTVPGDVLVGASPCVAALMKSGTIHSSTPDLAVVWWAIGASCLIYLFGLIQNDIFGAKTDQNRPIPQGEISLFAACSAAVLCLVGAFALGWFAGLPSAWFKTAGLLVVVITIYNKTKIPAVMGLCRGLNVACGTVLFTRWFPLAQEPFGNGVSPAVQGFSAAVLIGLYIALVTRYSEGEETDPARKQRVGLLIGALIYLQLTALVIFRVPQYLVAGAILLVLLRLVKRLLPKVSAS